MLRPKSVPDASIDEIINRKDLGMRKGFLAASENLLPPFIHCQAGAWTSNQVRCEAYEINFQRRGTPGAGPVKMVV